MAAAISTAEGYSLKAVWRFSSPPVTVHFYPAFLDRLREVALAAVESRSNRRGFLLGRFDPLRKTLAVTDLYPFSIKPRQDDNDNDLETAKILMARWRNGGGNALSVLGSYKVDIQGSVSSLTEDDSRLFEELPDEPSLLLTICGTAEDQTAATLTVRDGSELRTEFNDRFPLSSRSTQKVSNLLLPPPNASAISNLPTEEWKPSAASKWKRWPVILVAAVLAVAIGIGASYLRSTTSLPAMQRPLGGHLGLSAEMNNNELSIRWDPHRDSIMKADGGLLWIEDGGVKHALRLSRSDLDLGRASYTPTTARVSLRMEVTSGDRVASEEMVVSDNATSAVATPPGSSPRSKMPDSSQNQDLLESRSADAGQTSLLAGKSEPVAPPPSQNLNQKKVQQPLASASVQPADAAGDGLVLSASIVSQAPTARGKAAGPGYAPARILQFYSPDLSPGQIGLTVETNARVKVVLDSQGNVQQARVYSPSAALTTISLDAVRRFKFSPAHLNGRAVSSEVEINFAFRPAR